MDHPVIIPDLPMIQIMFKRHKFKLILAGVALISVLFFVYDSLTQPGINDLTGGYKELAVYRNENNTGPVVRIYAVSVKDVNPVEMQQYGEFMPYTKYGTTTVYFFKGDTLPDRVYPGESNFDKKFEEYCIAAYKKDASGIVTFEPLPFID